MFAVVYTAQLRNHNRKQINTAIYVKNWKNVKLQSRELWNVIVLLKTRINSWIATKNLFKNEVTVPNL